MTGHWALPTTATTQWRGRVGGANLLCTCSEAPWFAGLGPLNASGPWGWTAGLGPSPSCLPPSPPPAPPHLPPSGHRDAGVLRQRPEGVMPEPLRGRSEGAAASSDERVPLPVPIPTAARGGGGGGEAAAGAHVQESHSRRRLRRKRKRCGSGSVLPSPPGSGSHVGRRLWRERKETHSKGSRAGGCREAEPSCPGVVGVVMRGGGPRDPQSHARHGSPTPPPPASPLAQQPFSTLAPDSGPK